MPLARAAVRWSVGHALPRTMLRRSAKQGDLHGRMFVATQSGDRAALEPVMDELRAHAPFYRGKFASVTVDHAAVRALLSNPDAGARFLPADRESSLARLLSWAMEDAPLGPLTPPSLLVTEPPDHTRYRKLVSRVFSARAVEKLRGRTQQIATELLDQIDPRSPVDLVATYCSLLPVTMIAEILGVPERDREKVLRLGAAAAPSLDLGLSWTKFRHVESALREFDQWLGHHLDGLRRQPGDDLLSQLLAAQEDGVSLTDVELRSTAGLVLAAGFETTVNLLGNGIALLASSPEQRRLLAEREDLWPNAVEEVLRVDPPVLLTGRMTRADTEVAGVPMRRGSVMVALLAGANRDPQVFPEPDTFDITRQNAREHLSFSAGRHFCLGAALARMEGEVGLRTLFERYPEPRVHNGAVRRSTRILRGYERLPVTLSPLTL
ncbi:cytochrome P450 [Intrasporangium oryzae NRRL B-24470]|uniref:Cytochrome P450 n=1 Tax=Intrasporangium oryzae NRRL B-24470 TaxID=1386089 RepID=W9G1C8_9MICO|nr:cytochrome P450 [Intrasporangium oryzae NRRL B-24470]